MKKSYLILLLLLAMVSIALGWSNIYDTTTPLGSSAPAILDDQDRLTKLAVQERLDGSGMHFPKAGGTVDQVDNTDAGKFRYLAFTDENSAETADGGSADAHTPASNEGILDIKDSADDTVRELFFWDEQGNTVQITDNSVLYLAGTYDREINLTHTDNNLFADSLVVKTGGLLGLPIDTTDTTEGNIRYDDTGDSVSFRDASAWVQLAPLIGTAEMKVSSYTGDGGATKAIAGVGFQPDVVFVMPEGVKGTYLKSSSMATTFSKKIEGTGYHNNAIRSLDSDGFTVGDGSGTDGGDNMNTVSEVYHYIVLKTGA